MAGISRPGGLQRGKFMLLVKEKKKNVDGRYMGVAPKLHLGYRFYSIYTNYLGFYYLSIQHFYILVSHFVHLYSAMGALAATIAGLPTKGMV